jgi:predicted nucleotidyltransferase component of viral defense system
MAKEIKNLPESVRGRLQNYAVEHDLQLGFVMLQYVQERVAYRIGASSYKDKLLLKGGFYLITMHLPRERITRDIDLLARDVPAQEDEIRRMASEICAMPVEDGVRLDDSSLKIESVQEDKDGYQGFRVRFPGYIGAARSTVQLDIAFGDATLDIAEAVDLPTILDLPAPHVKVYPIESIISEKIETMAKLEYRNSRMNDFFDVFRLSELYAFSGIKLQEAMIKTFSQRERPIQREIPALTPTFYENPDKQVLWERYLARNRIEMPGMTLPLVAVAIGAFINPVLEACSEGREFHGAWDVKIRQWER